MNQATITFIIHWAPTLIFLFFLLLAILYGAWRGFRKSAILAIQAGILFTILVIVYLSIAGAAQTDTGLFSLVESIIGEGEIQKLLDVSPECKSFKECFIEFIPKQMPENEGLALILRDNGAYLATLAQMAVRIVVAIALGIVYILGVFLLYLIYLIFYPQRRYEKNLEREYYQEIENEELRQKRKAKKEAKRKKKEEALAEKNPEPEIIEEEANDAILEEVPTDEIHQEGEDDNSLAYAMMEDQDGNQVLDGDLLESEANEELEGESLESIEEKPTEEIEEEPIEEATEESLEEPEIEEAPKKKEPFVYKKRRLLGALIGGCRNLVSGLIFLSFVGGFFYILAGGPGNDTTPVEMDWQDQTMNLAYGAYCDIETYGTEGIFKILNAFKGSDNAPLYLFAADLVYQGGLKDEAQGIDENIYLRKELSTYTKFAKDSFNLVLKYGADEIREAVMNSDNENANMMDTIVSIMLKPGFQDEFNVIIDNFEETTYFINLTYSLINSFVNHIDKMGLEESVGTTNLSLIKLLFQKGYLADEIPYEKYVKEANLKNELENYYITPNVVICKDNAKTVLNIVFGYLTATKDNKDDPTKQILDAIVNCMPYITEFSFFQDENSETISMVLARLYQFIQNTYFKDAAEGTLMALRSSVTPVANPYKDGKYQNINWVNEIKSLVYALEDIVVLYNHAYVKDATVLDNIFNIFNTSNPTFTEDKALYEDIKNQVGSSFLLGDVLGGEYGNKFIEQGLKQMLPNLELPEIHYANVMNSDGTVNTYGEFYYLLSALQSFGENQDNRGLISDMQSDGAFSERDSMFDLIERLCDSLFIKDSSNTSVIDNILSSTLFTAVISEFIINTENNEGFAMYVDNSIRVVKDGNVTRVITNEELYTFFEKAKGLISVLKTVSEDANVDQLLDAILSEEVYNTLDSKLIEGTMSKYLADNISGDFIILPQELIDKTGYISTPGHDSEIKHIVNLFTLDHLDIKKLTKSYDNSDDQMNAIIEMLKGLTEDDFNTMFESKIMYYSLSNYLTSHKDGFLGDADLIIPNVTLNALTGESQISEVIRTAELTDFLLKACDILPNDMSNIDLGTLVNSIVDHTNICENLILSATMTNMMVNVDTVKDSIDGIIIISDEYKNAGAKADLPNYTTANIWYLENERLMRSIGALIGSVTDTSGNRVTITDANISDYIYDSFKSLNEEYQDSTRLGVAYESDIMSATITKRIDDMDFLSVDKKAAVKDSGIYIEDELESLVELINLFDLDLKNTDVLSTAMSTSTVLKLLDPYEIDGTPQSYSNLSHQYEHKITGLILTEGIEGATTVPTDAYETGELYISETEAEAIVDCLSPSKLNLDLNSFTFNGDNISVQTLKKCMYLEDELGNFVLDTDGNPTIISRILLQNLSDQVVNYDFIDIPLSDYDKTLSRINSNSAYFFLSSIESLDPTFKLSQTIDDVTLPDADNAELMEPIRRSGIFRASISKNVVISVASVDMQPIIKESYVVQEQNYKENKQLVILTGDETIATFRAIRAIDPDGKLGNVDIDLATVANYDEAQRAKVLASKLIGARISELIRGVVAPMDYTTRTTIRDCYTAPTTVDAINIKDATAVPAYILLTPVQMENYFKSIKPTDEVTSITVVGASLLAVGASSTYTVTFTPIDTSSTTVVWSIVSGDDKATINATTGEVTAIASGTVVIRATSTAEGYTDVYGEYTITIS